MNKYFIYILFPVSLALLTIGFSACEEEDELPSITLEGKNTFGCLVNGKLFTPKAPPGQVGTEADLFQLGDTATSVNIYGSNYASDQSFFISIIDSPELQIDKTYSLTDSTCCGIEYSEFGDFPSCRYKKSLSGHVKLLKFDINQKILSGTFEFKAYSDACNDTVTITEGRFDIGEIWQ